MTRPRPLTERAHEALAQTVRAGDRAVDATMGNGHDTLALARLVGPGGRVAAFDIQARALAQTRQRLDAAGLGAPVTLFQSSHEHMRLTLPADWPGRVAAVTFNLGYLPGGDKRLVTRSESTIAALDQALQLLRADGLLSLMVYRGHAGSSSEVAAVRAWLEGLPPTCVIETLESPGPLLYLVRERRSGSADPSPSSH